MRTVARVMRGDWKSVAKDAAKQAAIEMGRQELAHYHDHHSHKLHVARVRKHQGRERLKHMNKQLGEPNESMALLTRDEIDESIATMLAAGTAKIAKGISKWKHAKKTVGAVKATKLTARKVSRAAGKTKVGRAAKAAGDVAKKVEPHLATVQNVANTATTLSGTRDAYRQSKSVGRQIKHDDNELAFKQKVLNKRKALEKAKEKNEALQEAYAFLDTLDEGWRTKAGVVLGTAGGGIAGAVGGFGAAVSSYPYLQHKYKGRRPSEQEKASRKMGKLGIGTGAISGMILGGRKGYKVGRAADAKAKTMKDLYQKHQGKGAKLLLRESEWGPIGGGHLDPMTRSANSMPDRLKDSVPKKSFKRLPTNAKRSRRF